MFTPKEIYYEEDVKNYELGKKLLSLYAKQNIPMHLIQTHNNIEELRTQENTQFAKLKQNLILGIRKTHKFVPNNKISDFLVPYTSSGCTAMCLYCYLVCNYNKCSYLRLFVNREEMLNKIIKTANQNENYVFEIGSNSDLILENTITSNLEWTIPKFGEIEKGYITFPTKFDMVEPLLNLEHKGRTIVRMSVNPEDIIKNIEYGTSRLKNRIDAINKLKDAGYKVGILIAPIVLVDNWKNKYTELVKYLAENLSEAVKKETFFEIIFMTYSYVHRMINTEAFPMAPQLYDKEMMTGRGKGKYIYRKMLKEDGEIFLNELMHKYFPNNEIKYIV